MLNTVLFHNDYKFFLPFPYSLIPIVLIPKLLSIFLPFLFRLDSPDVLLCDYLSYCEKKTAFTLSYQDNIKAAYNSLVFSHFLQ